MKRESSAARGKTRRQVSQSEDREFKKGAYGAFMRLVIEDLRKYPPDGPGPKWKTWQPWAIKQLTRGLLTADAVVDQASNNAAKAARSRKTPTSDVTREYLLELRDAFYKKHKKLRGWKSSVAIDLSITGDAMSDLCKRHTID